MHCRVDPWSVTKQAGDHQPIQLRIKRMDQILRTVRRTWLWLRLLLRRWAYYWMVHHHQDQRQSCLLPRWPPTPNLTLLPLRRRQARPSLRRQNLLERKEWIFRQSLRHCCHCLQLLILLHLLFSNHHHLLIRLIDCLINWLFGWWMNDCLTN